MAKRSTDEPQPEQPRGEESTPTREAVQAEADATQAKRDSAELAQLRAELARVTSERDQANANVVELSRERREDETE